MPAIFYSLFFLVFLLFFLFLFLFSVFTDFVVILLEVAIIVLYDCDPHYVPPLAMHGEAPFYSACRNRILLF